MRSDYKRTQLYYAIGLGKFLIIDTDEEPMRGDYVITKKEGRVLTAECFRGQPHFGVVRFCGFYKLKHSDQSRPKKRRDSFPRDLAV